MWLDLDTLNNLNMGDKYLYTITMTRLIELYQKFNNYSWFQAYLQHMGGKHKAIHTFMSPEVLAEYSRSK